MTRAAFGAALALAWSAAWVPAALAQDGSWRRRLVGPAAAADLETSRSVAARIAGADTLGTDGEPRAAVERLLLALEAEENPLVLDAIHRSLARRGSRDAVLALAEALPAAPAPSRRRILRTLGAIGGEEAVRVLIEWLSTGDVGDDAVAALVQIGAPAVPQVIRALRVPLAAPRAAIALGAIGDSRASAEMASMLASVSAETRLVFLRSLGQLADDRVVPLVRPQLDDRADSVQAQAARTLAQIGAVDAAPAIESLLVESSMDVREAALTALVTLDPPRAAPHVEAWLAADEVPPQLRRAAVDAVLASPHAAFAPLFSRLLVGDEGPAAAEALARLPGPEGLGALLAAPDRPDVAAAIALALRRRHGSQRGPALRRLREQPAPRQLWLRALARDPSVRAELEAALRDGDDETVAVAIRAIALDGPPLRHLGPLLERRLAAARDPDAVRDLAAACDAMGHRVEPAALERHVFVMATAPEMLWLLAPAVHDAPIGLRRRLRRAMRGALRNESPRIRAGGALALGRSRDRSAWRALAATLDDPDRTVRLAASRALAHLAVPEAQPALQARLRIERDPAVIAALSTALPSRTRPPPLLLTGPDVLFAQVVTAPGTSGAVSVVDVRLPDGRWLRVPTLDRGEVVVVGLPAGDAEVQLALP